MRSHWSDFIEAIHHQSFLDSSPGACKKGFELYPVLSGWPKTGRGKVEQLRAAPVAFFPLQYAFQLHGNFSLGGYYAPITSIFAQRRASWV